MKKIYNLSSKTQKWSLSGWIPNLWIQGETMEVGARPECEIEPNEAKVPGSVQYVLRDAGIIPDWNIGLNFRQCEWVENRHWIYETVLDNAQIEIGKTHIIHCEGLDYKGSVYLNGHICGRFCNSHTPYDFDITPHLSQTKNTLKIVFEDLPRWLGQFGHTSKMREWKTRFNYTWDWTVRLVQIGIYDSISLEVTDNRKINYFTCNTDVDLSDRTGIINVSGDVMLCKNAQIEITLRDAAEDIVLSDTLDAEEFSTNGFSADRLPVKLWYTNMLGAQELYTLELKLISDGIVLDATSKRIGFKHIDWQSCEGASKDAYPWICKVNGEPIFIQGVNWTPILPNFADATYEDYKKRLLTYKDLGLNFMRVWGGATIERKDFYDLCDELGFLVWQEFPLSSSGAENYPPDDEESICALEGIARTYISRRKHHVSHVIWCSGNELQKLDGTPVDSSHPMVAALKKLVEKEDPSKRFLFTSPSGPVFFAQPENFGKGIHWHVHGPWKVDGALDEKWASYWRDDDAMFRSETGAPGASSAEIIRKYAGNLDTMPVTAANPLWRRTSEWWTENKAFEIDNGYQPKTLEEYVDWSQNRQTDILMTAITHCKDRFPRCGGFIIWMGHDCFPCTANTSILDFEGNPKPCAFELKKIWHNNNNIKI